MLSSRSSSNARSASVHGRTGELYLVSVSDVLESPRRAVSIQQLWVDGELQIRLSEQVLDTSNDFWKEHDTRSTQTLRDDKKVPCPDDTIGASLVGRLVAQALVEEVTTVAPHDMPPSSIDTRRSDAKARDEMAPLTFCGRRRWSHPSQGESDHAGEYPSWILEEYRTMDPVSETVVASNAFPLRVSVALVNDDDPYNVVATVRLNRQSLLSQAVDTSNSVGSSQPQGLSYEYSYRFQSLPNPHMFHRYDERLSSPREQTENGDPMDLDDSDDPSFCNPDGTTMVMFMKGFRRSLSSNNSTSMLPCLNYYFRTWTLVDPGKFHGAMVYSFLLAILTQGLTVVRAVVRRTIQSAKLRKTSVVLIYTLQQLMGYVLMFLAMMYSIELLASVVAGVACGYVLFYPHEEQGNRMSQAEREPLLQPTNNDEEDDNRRVQ